MDSNATVGSLWKWGDMLGGRGAGLVLITGADERWVRYTSYIHFDVYLTNVRSDTGHGKSSTIDITTADQLVRDGWWRKVNI